MKPGLTWLAIGLWIAMATSWAAEIEVVYPRSPEPDKPIVYADSLDSTFVFGHVAPPRGELRINDCPVPTTAHGAFLAFLAIRREPETKQWDLTLTEGGQVISSTTVPYLFHADLPPKEPDTSSIAVFPRVVRVSEDNAHTRTAPGGSYHLYPVKGTRLLATGWAGGFYRFRLDGITQGYIEHEFVAVENDSVLPPAKIGDGRCSKTRDSCVCQFALSRPAVWSSQLSTDARSLEIVVYDARLALDRFRYAPGGYLNEVLWRQQGEDVTLTLQFPQPLERGYEVILADDSLSVAVKTPFSRQQRTLKGKRIAVDAGHGGAANGTIGPLGTKEKNVTLQWAQFVAQELKRRGAIVILTRESDTDVPLYERVAIARRNRADMLVSLHANALPDGNNPFIKHGTGTYFNQPLSHEAARVLHRYMLLASGLMDDGIYDANFAVVRPTLFPSVLIEGAYLMYPSEEELLRSEKYLRQLAKGVAKGLAEYFKRQS